MVIYLNGSINSGKSTVAGLLARRMPRTVHIEVDDLRAFAACLTLEAAIPFCLEDALALTRLWVGRGFNVVVSWPISVPDHERFARGLADTGTLVHTFTLAPPFGVASNDRGDRKLSERERERVAQLYAAGINEPPFGAVIDNSLQSPEETAEVILRAVSGAGAA